MVSTAVFSEHFWHCYNTLQAAATDDVGMPGYFRFLTLLGKHVFMLYVVLVELSYSRQLCHI